MIYSCCDKRRRDAIKEHDTLNGIDFLEVLDNLRDPYKQRQRILFVRFIKELAAEILSKENIIIEGGERIQDIKVTNVTIGRIGRYATSTPGDPSKVLMVEVDKPGDFSTYTLRLVKDYDHKKPPQGFDQILSAIDFSFKGACAGDFDNRPGLISKPEEQVTQPEINYLVKDYAGFRQLMLDCITTLIPQWKERNPADIGVTLVELLAYVGDHLSYQQDAVATEAYLGTARKRISVKRHARLIDYFMHDGCNARVWVQVQVNADGVTLPKGTQLLTHVPGKKVCISPHSSTFKEAMDMGPEVFETVHEAKLFLAHETMSFYTWGNERCLLPKGTSHATLQGALPHLEKGDVLIFKETCSWQTGKTNEAGSSRWHPVRIRQVEVTSDELGGRFCDPPHDGPVSITEIKWDDEDALPFDLCISTGAHGDVSIALGNILLADHGLTISEDLGTVPDIGNEVRVSVSRRFRPSLKKTPLTHSTPYTPGDSAWAAMHRDIQDTMPSIILLVTLDDSSSEWHPKLDLLRSGPEAQEFVVEMEADSKSFLRFGDGQCGKRPESGTRFRAIYRVGNGVQGNIGAEVLHHIVTNDPAIVGVWNPMPAQGGIEPESIEEVRRVAPYAYRVRQERALTADDYVEASNRYKSVRRAAAVMRWTGSWHTAFITVEQVGGKNATVQFISEMRQRLERYRMVGHEVEVKDRRYVPLEIEMRVCVKHEYFRGEVKQALLELFSNRAMPDGRRGVFHPDNFTIGQAVYLSPLYASAWSVEGIEAVKITKFQRQGESSERGLSDGKLSMGYLEVARLDNDPDYPEGGMFNLIVEGGK